MINQRSNLSRKVKALIFILILICSATASIFTYVVAVSPSTPTIAGGMYAGAPSYTVFVDGGTYYAKSNLGANSYSSTNASSVFASVVTALSTSGGKVYVANGTYSLAVTLDLSNVNITLQGESSASTIIQLNGNVIKINNTNIDSHWGAQGVNDLTINGVGGAGNGLILYHVSRCSFKNLVIINCLSGLFLEASISNLFTNLIARANTNGVEFYGYPTDTIAVNANIFVGGELQSNTDCGAVIAGNCFNNKFMGTIIEGNTIRSVHLNTMRYLGSDYYPIGNIFDGIYFEDALCIHSTVDGGATIYPRASIVTNCQFSLSANITLAILGDDWAFSFNNIYTC